MEQIHFQSYAPPAGQEERRPVLPASPRAPEVQLCLTSSMAGERPALAKLWLLILFKGLMARHPRGVAASP